MYKRLLLPLALVLLVILTSGCWDRREVEELGLVLALGLDLGPSQKGVTVTVLIAVPAKMTGGGGGTDEAGEGAGNLIISVDAPSIYEAFNRINTSLNREITLLQNSTLIFGEALAQQGVEQWVDNLIRFREMRRTMLIFVAKGRAAEIMKIKPVLEKNPGEYFNELARLNVRNGMFPLTSLNDFLVRYEAFAQDNYMPLIAKYHRQGSDEGVGGSKKEAESKGAPQTGPTAPPEAKDARIVGTAIFRKDKYIGSFDIYESQVLQLLTGKFREAFLSIPDPGKQGDKIVLRLIAASPLSIKYRRRQGQDRFLVKLNLEADIISIQSGINYATPSKEALLGKLLAAQLKHRITKTVRRAQEELKADVFGFGIKVRNSITTTSAWNNYHWPEKFPAAEIEVKVNVKIRRVGMQFQPPETR